MDRAQNHVPVLARQVVESLRAVNGNLLVDGTLGMGGHTRLLLEARDDFRILAFDVDPLSLREARQRLGALAARVTLVQADYTSLPDLLGERLSTVAGVLVDPGISMVQLRWPGRGFSHQGEDPLDMRKNPARRMTAAGLLATADFNELERILVSYGDLRPAAPLVQRIVEKRLTGGLRTTGDLRRLVEEVYRPRLEAGKLHPAAKVFQALRIAVNGELDGVESFVDRVLAGLPEGGRLAFLTFHSLEDRLIKQKMKAAALRGQGRCLKPFPMVADPEEIARNAPSRPARLRVFEVNRALA